MSLHVASRGATNVPGLVRAIGCRVSADRRRVTAFLQASQCGALLADFVRDGAIAFVASLPSTHRTVQLKGSDAMAGPTQPGDEALAALERAAFRDDLVRLGYDPEMPVALTGGEWAPGGGGPITPTTPLVQPPGPPGGAPLAGKR